MQRRPGWPHQPGQGCVRSNRGSTSLSPSARTSRGPAYIRRHVPSSAAHGATSPKTPAILFLKEGVAYVICTNSPDARTGREIGIAEKLFCEEEDAHRAGP